MKSQAHLRGQLSNFLIVGDFDVSPTGHQAIHAHLCAHIHAHTPVSQFFMQSFPCNGLDILF